MSFLVFLFYLLQIFFILPIKDRRNQKRGVPWATISLIWLNALVYLGVLVLVILRSTPSENLDGLATAAPFVLDEEVWYTLIYPFMIVSRHIADGEGLGVLSALSSGFLHADTQHLLGNMLFLWFFGRKVEDSTGGVRFFLFYLLCLFGSALVSVIANLSLSETHAQIPGLGASGAIAGVMAAYLFLYSEERILTLFSVWLAPTISIPLPGGCFIPTPIPLWLPAWVFIIYKFMSDALLGQIVQEITAAGEPLTVGVGVFAHLGGAAMGFLFILLFLHPDVLAQRR